MGCRLCCRVVGSSSAVREIAWRGTSRSRDCDGWRWRCATRLRGNVSTGHDAPSTAIVRQCSDVLAVVPSYRQPSKLPAARKGLRQPRQPAGPFHTRARRRRMSRWVMLSSGVIDLACSPDGHLPARAAGCRKRCPALGGASAVREIAWRGTRYSRDCDGWRCATRFRGNVSTGHDGRR
jgi:hypothetical protein